MTHLSSIKTSLLLYKIIHLKKINKINSKTKSQNKNGNARCNKN